MFLSEPCNLALTLLIIPAEIASPAEKTSSVIKLLSSTISLTVAVTSLPATVVADIKSPTSKSSVKNVPLPCTDVWLLVTSCTYAYVEASSCANLKAADQQGC